jgi:hypothetical protein
MERLELSRYYYRGILNPLRLPFRHIGTPLGLQGINYPPRRAASIRF